MAGLLDYLFDPSIYGGDAGLLGRLSPSFTQLPQQQSPVFAPPQLPSIGGQRAAPIGVGEDYVMPRIGQQAAFTPPPASQSLPPQVANAQAQAPQAPPQSAPSFTSADQPGFMSFYQNMRNGGGLIGSIQAGITGQRTDPVGIQQQNLNAQFQATRAALIANGVPERQASSTAMLSVLNPKAAETVLPELLTNKEKYGVISDTPLEGKQYGFINEREQTVNGKPINAQGQPAQGLGGLSALAQAQQAGVTGEPLYEFLPAAMRGTVKAMIEGRQPLPSTTAMRNPATLALIDAAHAIDPTFDATTWKARNEAGPDWTKGKSSEMVRAANQTLAHVGSLMNAMDNLHNTRVPALNSIGNMFNEQVLGKGEPGAFRTNAHAVAEEMSKVFKGANLSDTEIRHWEQNLSENMSPEQQRAQIAKLSELLHGSLQALEEKRLAAMGPVQAAKMGPLIKDEGQKVLQRVDSWLNQGPAPAPTAPANIPPPPKPGSIQGGYRFRGGNPADKNNWEPIS